jgi:hypothetical protein
MKIVYLVLARWSEIDQHYELVEIVEDSKAALDLAAEQKYLGALAVRIETRTLPDKPGEKDAK